MPNEKVKITFYRIDQCGYYPARGNEPRFGCVEDMLIQLRSWGEDRQLIDTKISEADEEAEAMPGYLFGLTGNNDSWLVTIWNGTPSTDGQTAAVVGTSEVGNAEVVMNELPEGGIAGFATYFWFLPSLNVCATIRFQHPLAGQKTMQRYMESFLEQCTSYVTFFADPDEDADVEIAGYRENEGDEPQHLSPRFRTSIYRQAGQHDMLIQEAFRITKVLRKTTLELDRPEELVNWQRILEQMNLRRRQEEAESVRVKYEINTSLSPEEVRELIDIWQEEHDRKWDDYGFKLRGDQKIHWLSNSLARKEYDFDVARDNSEVVNGEALLAILNRRRDEITALMRRDV